MLLSELEPGQNAIVESVGGSGSIRRHLLDMGLTPNALVTLQKIAPMGDPIQITVRGFELTLRLEEANNVCVTLSDKPATLRKNHHIHQDIAHPGLGELSGAGDYRRHTQRETAKTGPLTFALVGNQNCGKTTLFNEPINMLATFPVSLSIGKTALSAAIPKPLLPTCLEFTRSPRTQMKKS